MACLQRRVQAVARHSAAARQLACAARSARVARAVCACAVRACAAGPAALGWPGAKRRPKGDGSGGIGGGSVGRLDVARRPAQQPAALVDCGYERAAEECGLVVGQSDSQIVRKSESQIEEKEAR